MSALQVIYQWVRALRGQRVGGADMVLMLNLPLVGYGVGCY